MTWICLSCMLWVGLAAAAGMLHTPYPVVLRLRARGGGPGSAVCTPPPPPTALIPPS